MGFGHEVFDQGSFARVPFYRKKLATFDIEKPINGQSIIQAASQVNCELLKRLQMHPNDLRGIDRRLFEEIVSELFVGFGYEVELTKRTRDGGKDIVAIRRKEVETHFLIECKRPDTGNLVQVSAVRELYGVKVHEGATKAIIATTSYLSRDAKTLVEKHRWELGAREFEAIQEWIQDYLNRQSSWCLIPSTLFT